MPAIRIFISTPSLVVFIVKRNQRIVSAQETHCCDHCASQTFLQHFLSCICTICMRCNKVHNTILERDVDKCLLLNKRACIHWPISHSASWSRYRNRERKGERENKRKNERERETGRKTDKQTNRDRKTNRDRERALETFHEILQTKGSVY